MPSAKSNRVDGAAAQSTGDPAPDLGYATHRLARLLRRRLEVEIAPIGLTGPQAAVLLRLAGPGERATMTQVAGALGMDRPTLSGVVARLRRDGWLELEENPDDGRSRLLRLSASGAGCVDGLERASGRVSAGALAALAPHERERFLAHLQAVTRALEAGEAGEADQADWETR
jgi:DNA-binding MarR family transcriptional regulator